MSDHAICLMGPTASGKTSVAVELCKRYPFEIISVDSALVYRGMDIGTAKPDAQTLQIAPHRLIDFLDPEERYSAGDFVRDARREMQEIISAGRVPLLTGGTMMYFRALTAGMAELPAADQDVRDAIDAEAKAHGWPKLHERLQAVDPQAALRINANDSQRIQRALEVFQISGRSLSEWQKSPAEVLPDADFEFLKIALQIPDRAMLHKRIEQRLDTMFDHDLVGEVTQLMQRPGLTQDAPSMKSVGYRQVWTHLAGESTLEEARYRALVATRQLAKRQITWLRSESELFSFDPLEASCIDSISTFLDARPHIFK